LKFIEVLDKCGYFLILAFSKLIMSIDIGSNPKLLNVISEILSFQGKT